jgi:uncharacterized RDD family membrane protein YckC
MPSNEEIVNLIKSTAKENQFNKMSIEELESLYQQGSALSNSKAFFKDLYLFEGVNQLKDEIKKRKDKKSETFKCEDKPLAKYDLASRSKRLGGSIIDSIILLIIIIITLFIMGEPLQSFYKQEFTTEEELILGVIISIAFLIPNGLLLFKRSQTIGKIIMKIKIVDHLSGNIPNFWKLIILRYLIFWLISVIPFMGIINFIDPLFIFGEECRCLHDWTAGTIVINTTTSNPQF